MLKKIILIALAVICLVFAYIAAGPYLTIRGIDNALKTRDIAALEKHVDFPKLRENVKQQVNDAIRAKAPKTSNSLIDGFISALTDSATDVVSPLLVETIATPRGVFSILDGHGVYKHATGDGQILSSSDEQTTPVNMKELSTRFDGINRFTATTRPYAGKPLVFVLERQGLKWRLTNIQIDFSEQYIPSDAF